MNTAKINRTQLPGTVKHHSKGRNAIVECRATVNTYGTWWDGGSKEEYRFVRLADGVCRSSGAPTQPFGPVTSVELTLTPGEVVVQTGTFCGKPSTMHVYCHPDDLCRVLGFKDVPAEMPALIAADWLTEKGRNDEASILRRLAGV